MENNYQKFEESSAELNVSSPGEVSEDASTALTQVKNTTWFYVIAAAVAILGVIFFLLITFTGDADNAESLIQANESAPQTFSKSIEILEGVISDTRSYDFFNTEDDYFCSPPHLKEVAQIADGDVRCVNLTYGYKLLYQPTEGNDYCFDNFGGSSAIEKGSVQSEEYCDNGNAANFIYEKAVAESKSVSALFPLENPTREEKITFVLAVSETLELFSVAQELMFKDDYASEITKVQDMAEKSGILRTDGSIISLVEIEVSFLRTTSFEDISEIESLVVERFPRVFTTYSSPEEELILYRKENANNEIVMQALGSLEENPLGAKMTFLITDTSEPMAVMQYIESVGFPSLIDSISSVRALND